MEVRETGRQAGRRALTRLCAAVLRPAVLPGVRVPAAAAVSRLPSRGGAAGSQVSPPEGGAVPGSGGGEGDFLSSLTLSCCQSHAHTRPSVLSAGPS